MHKRRSEIKEIHAKEKFDPKRATTGVLVPNIEKSLPNKFLPRFCQKLSPRRTEREKGRTKILAAIVIDKDNPNQVLSGASLSSQTMALPVLELESSSIDCYPSLVERLLDQ